MDAPDYSENIWESMHIRKVLDNSATDLIYRSIQYLTENPPENPPENNIITCMDQF